MIIGAGSQFPLNNSHCKTLLHLESNVTDYSADALTVTANGGFGYGNPGSAPFGTDAAYLENSTGNEGDFIQITYASKLAIGTRPYTISMWIYPKVLRLVMTLISNDTSTRNIEYFLYNDTVRLNIGGLEKFRTSSIISTNNWYHIALARETIETNKTKIFVNGLLKGTGTDNTDHNYTTDWFVGRLNNGAGGSYDDFYGYIKAVQIHIGQCLYTRNFTPPNRAA